MTTGPRYETAHELTERTGKTDTVVCTDCGTFVMDVAAHDRFHAALSGQDGGAPRETQERPAEMMRGTWRG